MKRYLKNNGTDVIRLLILMMIGALALSCAGDHRADEAAYTCPMHPAVEQHHKGTCPICGMDLVRKARSGADAISGADIANVVKSPREITAGQHIKTIRPQFRTGKVQVDAQGVVTYDTRKISAIATRVSGRLDKVFLKFDYQAVRKGEKVAEIYSPDLLTAQREFIYVLNNDPGNNDIIKGSKKKLSLLGLTSTQISDLVRSRQVTPSTAVYSTVNGYLIDPNSDMSGQPSMGSEQSNSMTESKVSPATPGSSSQLVKEGDYVSAGQTLFRIVSDNAYRIELDLPAAQASSIRAGEKLELDFLNGHHHQATIDFVQPFFNNGESFVRIRVYIDRMEGLHIGHLVKTIVTLNASESIWLPRQAIVYLGNRSVVFVREKGLFKPVPVQVGNTSNDTVEILKGVASSDEVASNAQFLVDSESFIKTSRP